MAALNWSDALVLDLPFMDREHHAFVTSIERVDRAEDARLAEAWSDLLACTTDHFAREDLWMRSSGFASGKDHIVQHRVVLEVMREGLIQAREGRLLQVREMARQLRSWYVKHVQTMDAALALHLRGMRFDPAMLQAVTVPGVPRVNANLQRAASTASASPAGIPDRRQSA
ncbi:hypothetical protein BH11PSE13_BH11PSE13_30370 [soil metagenome]